MPKQNSFSQFDMGKGTEAAKRGKGSRETRKVARKSPKNEARTAKARSTSGSNAQKLVDETRADMKARRKRVLRLGIN